MVVTVENTLISSENKLSSLSSVRRKEDLVTYSSSKVAELLPFNQPKGSCGNIGLFIPEMVDGTFQESGFTALLCWWRRRKIC